MQRCKTALTLIALFMVVTTTILAASSSEAQAATLRSRLTAARHKLSTAKRHLALAQADLAAATAGQPLAAAAVSPATPAPTATPDPTPSPDPTPNAAPTVTPAPVDPVVLAALQAAVLNAHHKVKVYAALVTKLAKALRRENQLALWERTGRWYPLVRALAAPYHVNAASLYRMLMLESGGRRFARGGGSFVGLFQYSPGTWHGRWNPYRHASIFNARAQICATAIAIRRGYGPHWWPRTYRMAF